MDNLISRQNVLRCLTDISYNQCKTQGEADVIDIAKTMVITMPSAQPVAKDTNVPNNDCISRQAAIDVLREYKTEPNISDDESEIKGYNDGIDLAISVLSTFPSAQPEDTICWKCKWLDNGYECPSCRWAHPDCFERRTDEQASE